MSSIRQNNHRIAKNTIVLYIQMILSMGIAFLAVRILLEKLGVLDYGLVNAIGCIVTMFTSFTMALSTAATRFFTFDLGRRDYTHLKTVFSMNVILFVCFAAAIVFLSETVGLWYLHNKMVMPLSRLHAANIFFQMTIGISVFHLIGIPYMALIIAHENMFTYACISIMESILRLSAAIGISFVTTDRLGTYGVFMLIVCVIQNFAYFLYCFRKYPESHFRFQWNKKEFKDIFVFSGWNAFGNTAWMCSNVFLSLLLNSFFGPIVNAARGIAQQVDRAVDVLSLNFLSASRPQIVKYWAQKDYLQYELLLKRVSKIGFFLLWVLALPILLETNYLLSFWLHTVPRYAVSFVQLTILNTLINFFSFPIVYGVQATGKIGMFETFGSGVKILVLPVTWLALHWGANPNHALLISCAITFLCVCSRFYFFRRAAKINARAFVWDIFIKTAIYAVISAIPVFFMVKLLPSSFLRVVLTVAVSGLLNVSLWYLICLNASEKKYIFGFLAEKLSRFLPKKGTEPVHE